MIDQLSYWEKTSLLAPFDFAIIGGGFTGRYIALELQNRYPTSRIAILDRGPIPAGASTRNAGFATFGNVSEILDDLKSMSEDEITQLISDRFQGLQFIRNTFKAKTFDFRKSGGWEIFDNKEEQSLSFESIEKVNTLMQNATGIKDLFQIKSTKKLGINALSKGIYNNYEGFLHPGKLLQLIEKQLTNVTFLNGFEVTEINGKMIQSMQGYPIEAEQIFIANNAFLPKLINEYHSEIKPARGQIIVTNPLDHKLPEGIYHCDKGYIYFRTLGNRILIGGGRNHYIEEETSHDIKVNENIANYLKSFLETIVLPNHKINIEHKWSGIMAMGNGKFPIIQKVNKHTIVCARMGGIGVALSPSAAKQAVSLV